VRFDALPPEVMERIVDKFVAELEAQLGERKIRVELTPAARSRLATRGYDPDFGARPLGRLIEREVKDPLSDEVLFGRLVKGGRVRVDAAAEGEGFTFEYPDADAGA
jgi:ATP-dependent Clp protease ATP-binding subunit ClpA